MADAPREVWITGVGLLSCLGEGPDAHWQGFSEGRLNIELKAFAPCIVHPISPLDFDRQIPKKSDQRQMEPWQRIGTYAAGLALENAGLKGKPDLLARTDMIVAASGGERDRAVDLAVVNKMPKAANPGVFLNETLMSDLRPTLFLAQLSNLLAGNISIVHGVTGSSRTFMGEEAAGVDAVRVAAARIMAGQSDLGLVGGSYNGERTDLLVFYSAGGQLLQGAYRPVWERRGSPGMVLGSLGAFVVLEARSHAELRGARPLARLVGVRSGRSVRPPAAITASLARMWQDLVPERRGACTAVISGATGTEPGTSEERAWLESMPGVPVRATGSRIGHSFEPQFIINLALATLVLDRGQLFPGFNSSGLEQPHDASIGRVAITAVGHWRGEGIGLVEAVK